MKLLRNVLFFPYGLWVAFWLAVWIIFSFPITLILLLFPTRITDTGMFLLMKFICNVWYMMVGFIQVNYHRRKIDFKKSYIITLNHQSFLDAAHIYTSIPHVFKTLGKIELLKTPIYGLIYKSVVITVDRSSLRARANSFRKMQKELEKGISIALFPEGTFPDEVREEFLPFQNGAFTLALMQETDILPILFLDTARRMPPKHIIQCTPGLNRSVFLPPVSTKGMTKEDTDALKQYVQSYMQDCLYHARNEGPKAVWDFAVNWQREHKIFQ